MDTAARWKMFLGSLDDFEDKRCVISGLSVLSHQGKVLYSSGWLANTPWDPGDILQALKWNDASSRLELQPHKFYIFSKSTKSVCGVTRGRRFGIVVRDTQAGIFVVTYQWPNMVEQVYFYLDAFIANNT